MNLFFDALLLQPKFNIMSEFTSYSFEGKKALIRVDFNVPLNDQFEITDDTRMRASMPVTDSMPRAMCCAICLTAP